MIDVKKIKLNDFEIGGDKLTIFAGPCVIENQELLYEVAETLKEVTQELGINYVFKSSFDKANRSSMSGFRGLGMDEGLKMLAKTKEKFEVPIVTDIHLPDEAKPVSEVADILQIPAFLCRQTDLLLSAGKTGKIVNIKKGQFLAPQQMKPLTKKVESTGNSNILLTERGTTFGYNNLVVDMRGLRIMQESGYPVVFDATHSVQLPGANGESTGGDRTFVPLLARSAVAAGVNALFFEIHPEPDKALCDGPQSLTPEQFDTLMKKVNKTREFFQAL